MFYGVSPKNGHRTESYFSVCVRVITHTRSERPLHTVTGLNGNLFFTPNF